MSIQIENNENKTMCRECGGRCCENMGCHYSPNDFDNITYESSSDSNEITVNTLNNLKKGQRVYITDDKTVWKYLSIIDIIPETNTIVLSSNVGFNGSSTKLKFVSPKIQAFGCINRISVINDIDTSKLLAGYKFFDTNLQKEVFWTGTKWVDATGADV